MSRYGNVITINQELVKHAEAAVTANSDLCRHRYTCCSCQMTAKHMAMIAQRSVCRAGTLNAAWYAMRLEMRAADAAVAAEPSAPPCRMK
jgi:hypothetical protein